MIDGRIMTSVCTVGGRTYVAVDEHGVLLTLQSPAGIQVQSEITSASARQLARVLMTAADDFEELEGTRAGSEVPAHVDADFPDEGNRQV
ncbi:hypothetical protein [Dongia deserti]|uniref:hypothetical protein n=1 Tax=Dongia deserti TaxID=2268030 RepID=UPI0013C4DBCB|nr:hypothetical protein [Dongia deserti]